MRTWFAAMLLVLAGCASPDYAGEPGEPTGPTGSGDPGDPSPGNDTASPPSLPAAIHETGVLPVGMEWECLSSACPEYPFTLETSARVRVVLSWLVPANDIDFMVVDESGSEKFGGYDVPPQTSEDENSVLPAGAYRVIVMPYQSATDQFTLDVTFEAP